MGNMSFNPDPLKQPQKVLFNKNSRTIINTTHPQIFFNSNPVCKVDYQKHLALALDSKLIFDMYIKTIMLKSKKT